MPGGESDSTARVAPRVNPVLSRVAVTLLVWGLVACGGGARAPVEDRNVRAGISGAPVYRVQQGDTLYSIAFRYGLDYRKVAAANGISAPYTIYLGQAVELREAPPAPVATIPEAAPAGSAPAARPVAPRPVISPGATAAGSSPAAAATPAPTPPENKPPGPVYQALPAAVPGPAPVTAPNRPVSAWRWPSSGTVTRRFSSSVHKGIDIGGQRGDPVFAVADGTVVYAGTGIVGFGELLIIKHNDIYISAYGHNDRLLVRENEPVRAGQKIAQKGSSGTDTVKLHFEIRREGKPVDPLQLLPRR